MIGLSSLIKTPIFLILISKINSSFKILSYPESGWHRVDSDIVTIFFHTDPIPNKDNPSHRHSDLLSFVFYYKTEPIFIDVGRLNYNLNDSLGEYGYSGRAHNSVVIDGFEAQAGINNRKFPDFYRHSHVSTEYNLDSEIFEFIIRHNGFCRLYGKKIKHTRSFSLSNEHFIIEDNLTGGNVHEIKTYFHCAPNLGLSKISDENYLICTKNTNSQQNKFQFSYNNNLSKKFDSEVFKGKSDGLGWHFPAYNKKEKISSLVFSQNINLPIINTFTLKWDN